jgi:NAD(P)H-dependent FMN reductase
MPTIGIIGSTRPRRLGAAVAAWVYEAAASRDDASFELIDLQEFALPHFDQAYLRPWAEPKLNRPRRGPARWDHATAVCS